MFSCVAFLHESLISFAFSLVFNKLFSRQRCKNDSLSQTKHRKQQKHIGSIEHQIFYNLKLGKASADRLVLPSHISLERMMTGYRGGGGGACWSTVYRCVNKRPQNLP